MTDFEFKFPHQVTAGSKAYLLGIASFQDNPYPHAHKQQRDAWDRGYRAAKRKHEADKARWQREARQEAIEAGFLPKPTGLRNDSRKTGFPERQVKKFNNKFRTATGE